MGEVGQVVEADGGFVKVRMKRRRACEKCRACAPGIDGEHMYLSASNVCGAEVDDWVSVDLDGSFFLKAVLIMYGLPLVTLLLGFGLGLGAAYVLTLPLGELVGFATGVAFAGLTYYTISRLQHRINRGNYTPVAGRLVDAPDETSSPLGG